MVVVPTSTHHRKPSHTTTIKLLCSYGGKILPRYPDGKLRYHGGQTRVIAVQRSISFSELLVKLGELCGTSVSFRCQLPSEDLDALVSITCDEDLINLIEEYDRVSLPAPAPSSLKIRGFLSLPKKNSPTPSSSASSYSSATTFEAASPKSPHFSAYSYSSRIRSSNFAFQPRKVVLGERQHATLETAARCYPKIDKWASKLTITAESLKSGSESDLCLPNY